MGWAGARVYAEVEGCDAGDGAFKCAQHYLHTLAYTHPCTNSLILTLTHTAPLLVTYGIDSAAKVWWEQCYPGVSHLKDFIRPIIF